MSNKKRTHTSAFKTKIVLEALREEKSIAELSVKYKITPKNIHNWKATFLSNAEITMEPSKCVAEHKQAAKELTQQVAEHTTRLLCKRRSWCKTSRLETTGSGRDKMLDRCLF